MRRIVPFAIALLLVLLAAGVWWTSAPPAPVRAQTPPPRPTPGARLLLRRPAVAANSSPSAAGSVPASTATEEPAVPAEVPPQGVGIPASALGPAIKETFEAGLKVDLLGCLLDADLAPGFDGKLLFDLHLDTTGLVDAAIVDLTDVPEGLRDCIADHVWTTEWPVLREGEVDVTYPVRLTVE